MLRIIHTRTVILPGCLRLRVAAVSMRLNPDLVDVAFLVIGIVIYIL